jgi:diaminopimelate epimerase
MKIQFAKYQGAGNDFVIIDNRNHVFNKSDNRLVAALCDRKFGIGADGLMLIENREGFDFEMIYYNSDGKLSSMCGNGGRCIVDYARKLGITDSARSYFLAVDGPHEASSAGDVIRLKMNDVAQIQDRGEYYFLDTGSPHCVKLVSGLALYDVYNEGRKIRHSPAFEETGTNVNFIERAPGYLYVRTYERGVEDETLACGTGVTASVLVAATRGLCGKEDSCDVKTPGGKLKVFFKRTGESSFTDVWLQGPAKEVFRGEVEV